MSDLESLIFYIGMFFIAAICIMIAEKSKKKSIKRIFTVIGLMIPIAISGVRYNVGTDFQTYRGMYIYFANISNAEIGMQIILRVAHFFNHEQMLFVLFAVLTVLFAYLGLKDNKDKHSLAFIFLLYLFSNFTGSFNIMRQALAVVIVFYAHKFLLEKKAFKFLFWVIIAASIHTTAILFTLVYVIVPNRKNNIKKIKWYQVVALLALLLIIFNYSTIMGRLTQFDMFSRYDAYANGSQIETKNRSVILAVMWATVFIIFRKGLVEIDEKNSIYIMFYILGMMLSFTGFISPYVKRIASYFTIYKLFLLGSIPYLFKGKKQQIVVKAAILLYVIAEFTLSAYILGHADIIPYRTIWGK